MNHPIHSFIPSFLGEEKNPVQQIAEECGDMSSADFDTKAGREQAFKSTAKCAAETACAIYGKGAIPPGVCSSIAGPIAGSAVAIWNSVFGDNEEAERAKIRDANTAKFFQARHRVQIVDAAWFAYSKNTMTRLIQFHDQNLPSRKGAWGGGTLTKREITHAATMEPGIPTKFLRWAVEEYSNPCPVFDKLVKLGGLQTKKPPASDTALCNGLSVGNLYYIFKMWEENNPKASATAETKVLNDLVTLTMPTWMKELDKAANTLRNEVIVEAVRKDIDNRRPKPSKAPIVVGGLAVGAGVAYWVWTKGLLKGIL